MQKRVVITQHFWLASSALAVNQAGNAQKTKLSVLACAVLVEFYIPGGTLRPREM